MGEGVCEADERMWGHFGHIQSDVTESHPLEILCHWASPDSSETSGRRQRRSGVGTQAPLTPELGRAHLDRRGRRRVRSRGSWKHMSACTGEGEARELAKKRVSGQTGRGRTRRATLGIRQRCCCRETKGSKTGSALGSGHAGDLRDLPESICGGARGPGDRRKWMGGGAAEGLSRTFSKRTSPGRSDRKEKRERGQGLTPDKALVSEVYRVSCRARRVAVGRLRGQGGVGNTR